jgi:hypothetical protein
MNFALGLGTGKVNGVRMDAAKLMSAGSGVAGSGNAALPAAGAQADAGLTALEEMLVAGGVSVETHQTIARQMNDPQIAGRKLDDPPKPVNQGALAGLILGSPEFQRR